MPMVMITWSSPQSLMVTFLKPLSLPTSHLTIIPKHLFCLDSPPWHATMMSTRPFPGTKRSLLLLIASFLNSCTSSQFLLMFLSLLKIYGLSLVPPIVQIITLLMCGQNGLLISLSSLHLRLLQISLSQIPKRPFKTANLTILPPCLILWYLSLDYKVKSKFSLGINAPYNLAPEHILRVFSHQDLHPLHLEPQIRSS